MLKWEHLPVPEPPPPVLAGPSSSLMTPHRHPYLGQPREPGRGPGGAGGWAGPQDIVFFFTPLAARPGKCNVPCCGHGVAGMCAPREAVQGPGRALGQSPGAQGGSGTAGTEEAGRDVGRAGGSGGRGWARPKSISALRGRKSVSPPKSLPQTIQQNNKG